MADPFGMSAVVGVGAGVLVDDLACQQVVRRHPDGMRHGHDRLFVPPVPDPAIACREGAGGGADAGGEGGLDQGGAEPAVAMASPAGARLARALVVAGAEARPT